MHRHSPSVCVRGAPESVGEASEIAVHHRVPQGPATVVLLAGEILLCEQFLGAVAGGRQSEGCQELKRRQTAHVAFGLGDGLQEGALIGRQPQQPFNREALVFPDERRPSGCHRAPRRPPPAFPQTCTEGVDVVGMAGREAKVRSLAAFVVGRGHERWLDAETPDSPPRRCAQGSSFGIGGRAAGFHPRTWRPTGVFGCRRRCRGRVRPRKLLLCPVIWWKVSLEFCSGAP